MAEQQSGKLKSAWGKLISKVDDSKKITIQNVRVYSTDKVGAARNTLNNIKIEKLINDAKSSAEALVSNENIVKYKATLTKASEDTWKYVNEAPEIAKQKYANLPKSQKMLAISAMAGGAIISIPFLLAIGPMSIVSALATLGLGALSTGGFGVAGGIIVTAGGATLAASLAGVVSHKLIDDPEVTELINSYIRFEEIIKQNFKTMENHQEKYKLLYEKYAESANYVAELQGQLQSGDHYDISVVRDQNQRVKFAIEDLERTLQGDAI
jgi:ribosomal protein L24